MEESLQLDSECHRSIINRYGSYDKLKAMIVALEWENYQAFINRKVAPVPYQQTQRRINQLIDDLDKHGCDGHDIYTELSHAVADVVAQNMLNQVENQLQQYGLSLHEALELYDKLLNR